MSKHAQLIRPLRKSCSVKSYVKFTQSDRHLHLLNCITLLSVRPGRQTCPRLRHERAAPHSRHDGRWQREGPGRRDDEGFPSAGPTAPASDGRGHAPATESGGYHCSLRCGEGAKPHGVHHGTGSRARRGYTRNISEVAQAYHEPAGYTHAGGGGPRTSASKRQLLLGGLFDHSTLSLYPSTGRPCLENEVRCQRCTRAHWWRLRLTFRGMRLPRHAGHDTRRKRTL